MNRIKRINLVLGLVLVVALALSACTQATTAPTEPPAPTKADAAPAANEAEQPAAEATEIWIVVGSPEGSNEQIMLSDLTKEYEALNPGIKVKWEWAGYELYDQKIRGYVESGNPPDAFGGAIAPLIQFAKEGTSAPLDEYLDQKNFEGDATWKDSFFPSLMEQDLVADAKEGSGYYAIPTAMHTGGIFYNEKIFADLGLEPPTTIQEMLAQCETIEATGISCFGVDGGFTPYNTIPFAYVASRIGGSDAYYDTALYKEGTSWVDNPDWLKAAEVTQQIYNYTQPGFLGSGWPAAQAEFSQGKMAMMWIPTWLPAELKGVAPDDFKMGLIRFPSYEGGKGDQTVTQMNFNGYSMPVGAKHPQEVMDFLKFLSSREVTARQAAELLIPSPTLGTELPADLAGVQSLLEGATTVPEGMGVDNDAPEWRTKILEPLLAELALGMDPAEFIAELQKQSDEYYASK